jgi:hypothetical protein
MKPIVDTSLQHIQLEEEGMVSLELKTLENYPSPITDGGNVDY